MDPIKIYQHVHHHLAEVNFRIARTEDIWDERNGKPDEPHRHNFYTILLLKQADGDHYIDFNRYKMNREQVFFVSPGQVHQIIEKQQSFGYVFMFSDEFLVRNNIPVKFIEDLNLFNDYGNTPPLSLDNKDSEKLSVYCEQMIELYQSQTKFIDQALGSLLQLFLIYCNNLCTLTSENPQVKEAGNTILKNFKQLVNEKYKQWHNTSEYAEELHVTPDHLNRVIKSLSGKTAKDYIQSRIIVAAKQLLYFSNGSFKEIAYELGFSEPGNFSAFFKKCTHMSPSQFRQKD